MKKATILRLYVEVQKHTYVNDISAGSKQIIIDDIKAQYAQDPETFNKCLGDLQEYIELVLNEYCCDLFDWIEYKFGDYPTVIRYNRIKFREEE